MVTQAFSLSLFVIDFVMAWSKLLLLWGPCKRFFLARGLDRTQSRTRNHKLQTLKPSRKTSLLILSNDLNSYFITVATENSDINILRLEMTGSSSQKIKTKPTKTLCGSLSLVLPLWAILWSGFHKLTKKNDRRCIS